MGSAVIDRIAQKSGIMRPPPTDNGIMRPLPRPVNRQSAPIADGPTLEEMPCPHRGALLGNYDCGCSGRPSAYACSLPDNASGLAIYPAKPLKKKTIIERNGSQREFTGQPQSCSGCQWRLHVGWETTRLPIDDGQLTADGTNRGIVTGCQAFHWPCLGALAIAAARRGVGLAVADHGLSDSQVAELNRVGVRWIEHEQPSLPTVEHKRRIPSHVNAWWKPWICEASPFAWSVWIDSDAVLCGDPAKLFAPLQSQTMLIGGQRPWQSAGRKMRYDVAEYFFGKQAAAAGLALFDELNAGVVAWQQGAEEIREWRDWCLRLIGNDRALGICPVRDQSALLLMCIDRHLRGLSLPTILPDECNWPADGLPGRRSRERRRVPIEPASLLATTAERHPDAVVVHWLARPKPWELRDA
jgi:hypothetical protein